MAATTATTDFVLRLRFDRGYSDLFTPAETARDAVEAVLSAPGTRVRSVAWVKVRPLCEYCTARARLYVRDSGEGTPLCDAHALDHYDTAAGVRAHTGTLGIRRFELVPEAEWKDTQG